MIINLNKLMNNDQTLLKRKKLRVRCEIIVRVSIKSASMKQASIL